MKTNQPSYWKPEYPPYYSPQGWELEKAIALRIMTLRIRFDRYTRMLDKTFVMFKAACHARDTHMMLRYSHITERLYMAQNNVAVQLICDYHQVLIDNSK